MINRQLLHPESIVVVGGSNNTQKPGGAIVRNLKDGGYRGALYVVNPKEDEIQGIKAFHSAQELPSAELAVLVVAARFCPDYVELLAAEKGTRAFIILSAGFGEETEEGARMEERIVQTCERYGAALLGPNCIGLLTASHHSVFTRPIPHLDSHGADFISGSGATAVFIMESAITKGLRFNSVWSVGNGRQIGIEDVLQHMDETFDPARDSRVKLLYIENISQPDKLLRHAASLLRKGCHIAAIKAGSSESGMRAASSHTGAMASSDTAVDALFRKAGIVRCFSREELTTMGCLFTVLTQTAWSGQTATPLPGREPGAKDSRPAFAIITHAGGPGVMLTDALSVGGLSVPRLEGPKVDELKRQLLPGAAVSNPIDILATGTPQHLATAIDYCEHHFDNIDAIFVIFGTPGLVKLFDTYDVLDQKIRTCRKPIFPILPSLHTAEAEVEAFLKKGHVNFIDEVTLATSLTRIVKTPPPAAPEVELFGVDVPRIREIIDHLPATSGYLPPDTVRELLGCAGIPVVAEQVSAEKERLLAFAQQTGYPVVAKVVGPVHKSEVGGVALNVRGPRHLELEIDRLMAIEGAQAVLVQPMVKGTELFLGATYEERFGHVVLCGLGGIFVEVLRDVQSGLAPLSYAEAYSMIRSLRGYKILQGTRGKAGINEQQYAEIIVRLSTLLRFATEIKEMDINPLMADGQQTVAVDARIRVEKQAPATGHPS